ncbi:hypothetical protein BCR41DRAFT_345957, partial [Lobosporangium transversale]
MSLLETISAAGLAQKALINGVPRLRSLMSKELVSILKNIGAMVGEDNHYYSLSVINMNDLYVRSAFKKLYDTVVKDFYINRDDREPATKIVVTGTAGIGKSSFLVYFAIRLLAVSNEEDPPITIIQKKESSKCYAFGGRYVVRYGDMEDFMPFLQLSNTWFPVDSAPSPELTQARTIFSVSPRTLLSSANGYQEIMKR